MAKRKEYLNEAETAIFALLKSYAKEHEVIPHNIDAILKTALTKARGKILCELSDKAGKRLGYKYGYLASGNPDYYKTRKQIIEEANNVQDLRV